MAVPKSVSVINRVLFPNNRFLLGTRLYETITLCRELYDDLVSGGSIQDLVNELRAHSNSNILSHPDLKQNTGGGGNTQVEIGAAFSFKIAGVTYTKGTTQDIALAAGANTGAAEFKQALLSIVAAGTLTWTYSAAAASAGAVVTPSIPADSAPVGILYIGNSFTAGTTVITTSWLKGGYPHQKAALTDLTASKPEQLKDTDG